MEFHLQSQNIREEEFGLSPILRGKPSEEVNAIGNLEAIAIDDTRIEQLYLTNKTFEIGDTTLHVSEYMI